MKFAKFSKSVMFGAALILASTAFASTKGSLELSNPVTVAGTTLKPGDYSVEWNGAGPQVEVSILQGKKVLAKVPGQIVELQDPAPNDAAVVRENGNGPKTLAGVRFQGKKLSLELNEGSDGMPGGSSK